MIRVLNEIAVMLSVSPAVSLAVKGTIVMASGLAGAWLARKSRAAVRHALLASAFGVLLALPVVSTIATPVPIAVPVAADDSMVLPLFDFAAAPSSGVPAAARVNANRAEPGWQQFRPAAILLYGWFIGAALFLIPVIGGLLQVRTLRRCGLPWRQGQAMVEGLTGHRRVEVMLHEALTGPMTCGVLHPAIILPAGAQNWDRQDLERALVHELEHVRRYDWAIHCLARLACAAYWFHPLVWTAWRQLTLEAERSCDDAVLRNSEAIAYADQLVGLARKRSLDRKSPALAMASRCDLGARVKALLDGTQRRGPVGALLIAASCIAAAAIVLTMSPLRMVAAPQSTPHAAVQNIPKWDAVSIKRCSNTPVTPGEARGAGASQSPDRLTTVCLSLGNLVQQAYVTFADGQHLSMVRRANVKIEGISGRDGSEKYVIEAKAQGSPGQVMMHGPMLQALLEDRFHLKVHEESREGPVYILSVAKGGPKLQPFRGSCTPADATDIKPSSEVPNSCPQGPSAEQYKGSNATWDYPMNTDNFAFFLTQQLMRDPDSLGVPVVNQTGLVGIYQIHLEYLAPWMQPGGRGYVTTTDPPFPSIFTAVQKLGLKLEAGKGPTQVIVVDHAERPSEN